MSESNIKFQCPRCKGLGSYDYTENISKYHTACIFCAGVGFVEKEKAVHIAEEVVKHQANSSRGLLASCGLCSLAILVFIIAVQLIPVEGQLSFLLLIPAFIFCCCALCCNLYSSVQKDMNNKILEV